MSPPTTEMLCGGCRGAIEASRYHAVGGKVFCDRCAPDAAIRVLDALSPRNHAEETALDVVRQFAREHMAGCWQRRQP
jgi:hypothetical protein